jgi:hypothetical protein
MKVTDLEFLIPEEEDRMNLAYWLVQETCMKYSHELVEIKSPHTLELMKRLKISPNVDVYCDRITLRREVNEATKSLPSKYYLYPESLRLGDKRCSHVYTNISNPSSYSEWGETFICIYCGYVPPGFWGRLRLNLIKFLEML